MRGPASDLPARHGKDGRQLVPGGRLGGLRGRGLDGIVRRLVAWEAWLVVASVLALLAHPTPFTVPAVMLGSLPSLGRLLTRGRPWRPTPFDLPLLLLVLGSIGGALVSLDPGASAVRLAGLAAGLMLFGWMRESADAPSRVRHAAEAALIVAVLASIALLSVAAPFLLLDRVPPLRTLADLLEPIGLHRPLVQDPYALDRYRPYASGAGALAAAGLAIVGGLVLGGLGARRRALVRIGLALAGAYFVAVLVVADNRGSLVAAAIALGLTAAFWRPRLFWLAPLIVFLTADAIALGVANGRGLTTVLERVQFWAYGLRLAGETPLTGIGLGSSSVALAYRAAFQPTYPPFSHAHSIYVQGLLEMGVLGLASLLGLAAAVVVAGVRLSRSGDTPGRGGGLAACAGALALLAAGLTEVIALTTVGGAALLGLCGILAAAASRPTPVSVMNESPPLADDLPPPATGPLAIPLTSDTGIRAVAGGPAPGSSRAAGRSAVWRGGNVALLTLTGVAALLLGVTGAWRGVVALPLLNAGTTELYRATLPDRVAADRRAGLAARSAQLLEIAATLDPDSLAAQRNLGLARAALGDRAGALVQADRAAELVRPGDRLGLFGVGRVYAAVDAWPAAIRTWEEAGAGPQLVQLGQRLVKGPGWEHGIGAFVAAARLDAPGRLAVDAIGRASLEHGESVDEAIARIRPLAAVGGRSAYHAWLQVAHLYRTAGRPAEAGAALVSARQYGEDAQLALEQALLMVDRGEIDAAYPLLRRAAVELTEPLVPQPAGSDPRYWLAVAEARLGRPEAAVQAARLALADLPPEQARLRPSLALVLGESLVALGRREEAVRAYRDGLRAAPSDRPLQEALRRAQAGPR